CLKGAAIGFDGLWVEQFRIRRFLLSKHTASELPGRLDQGAKSVPAAARILRCSSDGKLRWGAQLMAEAARVVRIAAIGDLHCGLKGAGSFGGLLAQVSGRADVLVLCGDLTDSGLPDEARVLCDELAPLKLPVVAVLGNHD